MSLPRNAPFVDADPTVQQALDELYRNQPSGPIIMKAERATSVALSTGYNGPLGIDEVTDTGNAYNGSRFQPKRAGWYYARARIVIRVTTSGVNHEAILTQNVGNGVTPPPASTWLDAHFLITNTSFAFLEVSRIVYLNGTTDYLEVFHWQNGGGTLQGNDIGAEKTFCEAYSL